MNVKLWEAPAPEVPKGLQAPPSTLYPSLWGTKMLMPLTNACPGALWPGGQGFSDTTPATVAVEPPTIGCLSDTVGAVSITSGMPLRVARQPIWPAVDGQMPSVATSPGYCPVL